MNVLYRPPFRKFVKKQSRAFQLAIEDEVHEVLKSPYAGETKRGDLEGITVHKFKFHRQEYLMAYAVDGHDVVFHMIGTHENFYRALKAYMKETE
jgi:mRNA-degrading endonuclease RelE of RelBE toxin-antitoxin system